jgi:hypothetical protein
MSESGFTWQEFVFSTEVAGRECSFDDCSRPVAAIYSMARTIRPGKVVYESIWACHEDANDLMRHGDKLRTSDEAIVTGWGQELLPTCLREDCGQDATHLVLVARDYDGKAIRLEAMSLCGTHADQIASDLPHVSGS